MESIKHASKLSYFIRQRIKDKGFNSKEFAEVADLADHYIYRLFSEKRLFTPKDEMLYKIAKVLNWNWEDLKYILDLALSDCFKQPKSIKRPLKFDKEFSILSYFIRKRIADKGCSIKEFGYFCPTPRKVR